MNELVILDLDGVIIEGQSQLIFLKYLLRKRIIGLFFYLKIYFWFVLYKMGVVRNPEHIMNFAFSFLKGKRIDEIDKIVHKFFREKFREFIFPEIIDIINKHKTQDRELLIVSNTIEPIANEVARHLGIKNVICTKLEMNNEVYTGKILGKIVYGENKTNFFKKFIKENNLTLRNSYAYADHISDLDLLQMVSNPYAVNPDRFLLSEAKKANWAILNFK